MSTQTIAADGGVTQRVFAHHLVAFSEGIDAIMADYTERSVLMTPDTNYRGLHEIRGFFDAFLKTASPEFWSAFKVGKQTIDGDVAYLTWSSEPFVALATDTLVVSEGKILVQTFTPFHR